MSAAKHRVTMLGNGAMGAHAAGRASRAAPPLAIGARRESIETRDFAWTEDTTKMAAVRVVAGATIAGVAAAGAAEALCGPLPFARSALPSPPPIGEVRSPQSFCVGLAAHALPSSIAQRKPGSNYGKLDEEAAMRELERALRARTCASPLVARLLALPPRDGWERAPLCLRSAAHDGVRTYVWVSVKDPRWVGDDLDLVVHVCTALDADHATPSWASLTVPRRYAALCVLEACVRELLGDER